MVACYSRLLVCGAKRVPELCDPLIPELATLGEMATLIDFWLRVGVGELWSQPSDVILSYLELVISVDFWLAFGDVLELESLGLSRVM